MPGFRESLRRDPAATLARVRKKHVPLLYWTAAAWGARFGLSKEDSDLGADQAVMEAMVRRALVLDEAGRWAPCTTSCSVRGRPAASAGGSVERARAHFARLGGALRGTPRGPVRHLAETVAQPAQDRREFEELLQKALEVDPDAVREQRLANLVSQKRARWLLARVPDLFVE